MSIVAEHISDAYEFGAIHSIEESQSLSGQKSAVIHSSRGTFFMKEYTEEQSLRVPYISVIERYFYEHDVPVILSLPVVHTTSLSHPVDQSEYAVQMGSRTYVLYPYIEHPSVVHRDALTPAHIQGFAIMHACMHSVGEQFIQDCQSPEGHIDLLNHQGIINFLQEASEEVTLDHIASLAMHQMLLDTIIERSPIDIKILEIIDIKKRMINLHIQKQGRNEPTTLTLPKTTLLHGDMHEQNVFFDSLGNVAHIFDFDNFSLGSPEYELAQSILHVCFGDARFDEREFSLAHIYLSEYKKVRPINTDHLRNALEYSIFQKCYSTTFEENHYFNQIPLTDVYIDEMYRTMKYFEVHTDRFVDAIIDMCGEQKGE